MARNSYVCESCGIPVAPKDVEDGGAFYDGEHCYCAICVARLVQKVQTAQQGGRMKTAGVVFQKGLSTSRSRAPSWLLYTIIAEAALGAILLLVLLSPSEVKLPGDDPIVKEEVRIKALLTDMDAALAQAGQATKALSILQEARSVAAGHPWLKVVEERIESAQNLFDKEAREAFARVKSRYNTHMASSAFEPAIASLDEFPQEYRNTSFWKEHIHLLRQKAQHHMEAHQQYQKLLSQVHTLRRNGDYGGAIECLQSFPAKFSTTPTAAEVASLISQISAEREEEEHDRERLAEEVRRAEQARLEEEERRRKARQEQERLAAEDDARRRAEELAKREAEKKIEPAEKPEPEKPDKPVAEESKIPWEEVELSPGNAREFPFATPRPFFVSLQRGAVGNKLFVPFPHKGKISGFGVEDYKTAIRVDRNADGKPDKRLPADGGVVVLKVSYEADQERPCAVEIRRQGGVLKYRRYGWMAGKYKGTNIAIIDENSNGKYNDHSNLEKKNVGRDAIVVGRSSGAAVLSNIIVIKDKFYEIKVDEDGSKLRIRPHETPAGKLSLTKGFKARGKLTYAVAVGIISGTKLVFSVELASERKPVTVPTGEYFVFAGEVIASRRKNKKIFIYGGPESKDFKIGEAATVTPAWGAPGFIEFKYILEKSGMIDINPYKIRLFGSMGEEYLFWGPMEFVPRVQVRTAAGKQLADEPVEVSADFTEYYRFEKQLPMREKFQVRIVGEPNFLGPCASDWK